MAKKTLTLLIVVFLMGPALGLVCSCCPVAEASSVSVISSGAHHCCDVLSVNPENCSIDQTEKFFTTNKVSFFNTPLANLISHVLGVKTDKLSPETLNLPSAASETPLYLALQILRL